MYASPCRDIMMNEAKMMSTRGRQDEKKTKTFLTRLTRGMISSLSIMFRISRSTHPHWTLYGLRTPVYRERWYPNELVRLKPVSTRCRGKVKILSVRSGPSEAWSSILKWVCPSASDGDMSGWGPAGTFPSGSRRCNTHLGSGSSIGNPSRVV